MQPFEGRENIFCYFYSWNLAHCLAHSVCSTKMCWCQVKDLGRHMKVFQQLRDEKLFWKLNLIIHSEPTQRAKLTILASNQQLQGLETFQQFSVAVFGNMMCPMKHPFMQDPGAEAKEPSVSTLLVSDTHPLSEVFPVFEREAVWWEPNIRNWEQKNWMLSVCSATTKLWTLGKSSAVIHLHFCLLMCDQLPYDNSHFCIYH